jgi:hypothetical protein
MSVKQIGLTKRIVSPQIMDLPGDTKLKAIDIVRALEISNTIWSGARRQFSLNDGDFMTEAQLRTYITAFLNTPASK